MITREDVVALNRLDDKGKVVNEGSLAFALSVGLKTKDWVTQVAYLLRAILLDHVFEDGNKRTALSLLLAAAKDHTKGYDLYKLDLIIKRIIEQKISDIKTIKELIKDAVW